MKRLVSMAALVAACLPAGAAGPTGAAAAAGPAATLPQVTSPARAATTAPASAAAPARASLEQQDIRAQLAPHRYTTLAAEVGARINRLPVPEGGSFKAGQALVVFDCALQQSQLNKARASLTGSEKIWSTNQRLAELNSIGRTEVDVSEAEVLKNRAEVASMSTLLGKCSIAAPFSGRVAEQRMREQQFAQPGQAILDILDDSVLELEFLVPSKWLAWVKAGSPLKVAIDETRRSYPAKVQRIGARIDPVSQSIKLVATIDGRYPELIAGMSGHVVITPTD